MLEDGNGSRLFLISCVKTKGAMPASAMDLYTSNWFRKARACVETTGCPWRILSAQYGLVHPEEEIGPYEKTLNTMRVEARRAWADRVLAALAPCLDGVDTVVFLAGQRYRQFLEPELRERGLVVRVPMSGLRQGQQLAWLNACACRRVDDHESGASLCPSRPEEIPARSGDGHAVAAALLQYDSKNREPDSIGTLDFTPNAEANALLRTDAFAFLTAVLFDQGVPAERAWTAPYLLRQRMGHLDPARSAGDPEGVRRAIQMQPKLHRYIKKMPRWLVGAARRVEQDYHGDASAIWSARPSAVELQRRLSEFHGIGQKKAAMAVEILNRDLGVPVDGMAGSDVAVDVHVRRVFLRSRIADRDDRDHMITAARQLHPSRPGALDFPAWDIGRNWCHAGAPDCGHCPLTHVCPKDIERAAGVTSA